jgi:hypothetical protein
VGAPNQRRECAWIGVLLAVAAGGCDPVWCRAGTLYLTLEYAGAAQSADQLDIDITVGDQHQSYVRPRTAGTRRDTLEVTFRQYPDQARIVIRAAASIGGTVAGSGQLDTTLDRGCSALVLSLGGDGSATDADAPPPPPPRDFGAADGPPASGDDLAEAPADLRAGAADDLSQPIPPDLASSDLARLPPVVTFSGLTNTAQFPSGTTSPEYSDSCPPGLAIGGINYLVQRDSNGMQVGINRADPICIHPDVNPTADGGWKVAWGKPTVLNGHGVSGAVNVQQMCPMDWYLTGFRGRSGAYLDQIVYTCAQIVIDNDGSAHMGPNLDIATGVGGNGGSPFGPVVCQVGQVVTVVRSRALAESPPDAFGFGCSIVSAH